MGFDNAHGVASLGGRYRRPNVAHDHWHSSGGDAGRPYVFTTTEQLSVDFEAAVERVLAERGIDKTVVGESDVTNRRPG